ncbi:hypothetical protein B0T14DRAFT_434773 [Immersiella caudata]|uniref:Uncharacterized protein n=1 Tax=Immersiella caudata TaxID=314043 RepID=A0AA39WLB2_9PEZI|nr:hypothetical protein B0T14DRAFT_434773 [Immersiella caudata]
MFSFHTLATLLAVAVLSVTALPATNLESRQSNIQIQYCTDIELRGACNIPSVRLNQCHDVPGDFKDRISSFKNLNKNQRKCTWYEHFGCTGNSYKKDEDLKLHDGNGKFNDYISSVICAPK